MRTALEILFAVVFSYALIPLLGFACKLWFSLFMWGWGLI